jgi:hypothetical protein
MVYIGGEEEDAEERLPPPERRRPALPTAALATACTPGLGFREV